MMRVEVKSPEVRESSGTGKRGPFLIRKQAAYLDVGKAYPVEVAIRLNDGQQPFAPGMYEMGPECFYQKQYNEVGVDLSKIRRPAAVARAAS